jgi:thymidylate synthase
MSKFEIEYTNLVSNVIMHGEHRASRVGHTVSLFGAALQITCLENGLFPILTQRKIFLDGILGELAGFLRGATTVQEFKSFGCNYWDANAKAWPRNADVFEDQLSVGEVYGYQWRNWAGYLDQLSLLVKNLKRDPYSRRHLLTTYDPARLAEMCLPPCHLLTQYNVRTSKHLDCIVTMRSVDLCLGLPSDIILYATLLVILCNETGYTPGKLTFMLGDTHVYKNHIDQFQKHAQRPMHKLPRYKINGAADTKTFVPADLSLEDYKHSGVLSYALNT